MNQQALEEATRQNVRTMIGDLMIQLAQARAEIEMLKAQAAPARPNGRDPDAAEHRPEPS